MNKENMTYFCFKLGQNISITMTLELKCRNTYKMYVYIYIYEYAKFEINISLHIEKALENLMDRHTDTDIVRALMGV